MLTIHFADVSTFPVFPITSSSTVSRAFLELGIEDFRTAAQLIHSKPYWKNTDDQDVFAMPVSPQRTRDQPTRSKPAASILEWSLGFGYEKGFAPTAQAVQGARTTAAARRGRRLPTPP